MRSDLATRSARRTSRRDDRGATAVEYALIIAGVAIAIVTSVALIGGRVGTGVANAAQGLSGAPTTASTASTAPAPATPSSTATPTPTSTAGTCNGTSVAAERGDVAPTCPTGSTTWQCPRGYGLERVGAERLNQYTCRR